MNFEIKMTYEKTTIDGLVKKATEAYLVNAETFSDAEMKMQEYTESYGIFNVELKAIRIANYAELIQGEGDAYFDVKIGIITLDEKNGREKQSKVNFLVCAETLEGAKHVLKEAMLGSMMDYRVVSIKESKIVDTIASTNIQRPRTGSARPLRAWLLH